MERISQLERDYVNQVLDNAFATSLNSVFNNRLEAAFAKKFNQAYAIGHCNGTATLHTAVAALGLKSGDEVVVPALTMTSTSFGVLHNGSIPVFADSDLDTFEISAEIPSHRLGEGIHHGDDPLFIRGRHHAASLLFADLSWFFFASSHNQNTSQECKPESF